MVFDESVGFALVVGVLVGAIALADAGLRPRRGRRKPYCWRFAPPRQTQWRDCATNLWTDPTFRRRLAEAVAWSAGRADARDPEGSLRSSELTPSPADLLHDDRAATVTDFIERRRAIVGDPVALAGDAPDLRSGRLVVSFPDEQLDDGASQFESGGFFDLADTPPWDTWVGLYHDPGHGDYLVSWVPSPFLEHAERGIPVNAVGCILWLAAVTG